MRCIQVCDKIQATHVWDVVNSGGKSTVDVKDFYRLENFLCHYIVPLWFLADTLFFDKQGQYKIWDPVVWTILPLLYMIFALFNGLVLKLDVPNSKVSPFPYFFLNVNKGWDVVFKWCLIIFVAYMVAGFIFYFIKQIKRKSS